MKGLSDRFWAKVQKAADDECWNWVGAISEGYGLISNGGKVRKAHRIACELLRGPIPPGLQIDHLCRNRKCVNPAHLEVVTQAENLRRSPCQSTLNAAKTHCPKGHEYDYHWGGMRFCLQCHRARRQAACR